MQFYIDMVVSGRRNQSPGFKGAAEFAAQEDSQSWLEPWPQVAPTHLGLLLVQFYLNVCQLGPEVFVGSLEGDNECLGLLALISPFLGHCSLLNGVFWILILSNRYCHVTVSFPGVRCFSNYCVVLLAKVFSTAAPEALGRNRDNSDCWRNEFVPVHPLLARVVCTCPLWGSPVSRTSSILYFVSNSQWYFQLHWHLLWICYLKRMSFTLPSALFWEHPPILLSFLHVIHWYSSH